MKDFFSEYGRVVLSALVTVLLLTVAVAIKPLAASSCENIVAKLTNYADDKLDNPESLESTVSLISFTIDGTPYQATEGMTWEAWIISDYCPDPENYSSDTYCIIYNTDLCVGIASGIYEDDPYIVEPGDAIISGQQYDLCA